MANNKTKEFSLTVKGAGTKEDVIKELEEMIRVIKGYNISQLQLGIDDLELPNLTLKTGPAEDYY